MLIEYPWFSSITANLSTALTNDRLPHALLIQAPFHSGKADYAFALSQSLLCSQVSDLSGVCGKCKSCQLFAAGTHPDFYSLDKLVDTKGKQKKSIGIDQVRELTTKLQDTAQLGGYRIAVIHSVESMTTASFNALLKTLEEPGNNTILILLANNLGGVPATIRSRCQMLKPDLSEVSLVKWLASKTGGKDSDIKTALANCFWAPLAALSFIQEDGASQLNAFSNQLDAVLLNQHTPADLLSQVDTIDESLIDQMANYFHIVEKNRLLAQGNDIYQQVPDKLIFQLYAKLLDLKRAQQAGSNLQIRLQIEVILIQWFEFGKKIGHYSSS